MAVSNVKVTLVCEVEKVWKTVTNLEAYTWRSELGRIEILNDKQFVEYTKEGFATMFTTTVMESCRRWEFDMENDNIKGHWTGIFTSRDGQTELELTEDVTAKNIFMKPFVKAYLKKQQGQYVSDLKKALAL